MFTSGYWYCGDCDARCERIEGEHGQPAHCDLCGSHKIKFVEPVIVGDTQLIQPGELSGLLPLPILFARGGFGGGGAAVLVVVALLVFVVVAVACEPRRDK